MINCKICKNKKNCVYAGEDREMEECVDRIPTTHSDIIRSMTDEELADVIAEGFCSGRLDQCNNYKRCTDCTLDWLREEVEA